jgi:hypothetical protein
MYHHEPDLILPDGQTAVAVHGPLPPLQEATAAVNVPDAALAATVPHKQAAKPHKARQEMVKRFMICSSTSG